MVGPKGNAHEALGRCKRKFCEGQGPDVRDLGVGTGNREGLFLAFQTEYGEALSPSYDPMAQHINRGAGLAPRTHQKSPSRVPVPPFPLVHPLL